MKPLLAATATEAPDEQLVAAARAGSDQAFEALFRRYRDRVVGYVRGMVSDHGRAEDIVQEAFMSALRSLRRTDQEIVFKPWIYEIAKNACIDHLRRARRAQEVSIDSDDFGPGEESRLSQAATGTDAAVARRSQLESLRMAFHDLPPTQHEILVMRELEGLSYDSIGSRMGLTRGAVESLLFRARRRLRVDFDEIDTGARCQSMRAAMQGVSDGSARARERRRLSSHLHDCKPCRRHAVALGLDPLVLGLEEESRARRAARRVASLLPLPLFLRRRLGDAAGGLGPASQAGVEQGVTLAGKAGAVIVAAVVAAGGAGVAHKASGGELPLGGVPVVGDSAVAQAAQMAQAAAARAAPAVVEWVAAVAVTALTARAASPAASPATRPRPARRGPPVAALARFRAVSAGRWAVRCPALGGQGSRPPARPGRSCRPSRASAAWGGPWSPSAARWACRPARRPRTSSVETPGRSPRTSVPPSRTLRRRFRTHPRRSRTSRTRCPSPRSTCPKRSRLQAEAR